MPTLDAIERLLEPYRHLDPKGWLGLWHQVPPLVGVALIITGALLLFFGGRGLFRLLAGPVGALIALVWAETLATRLGFAANAKQISVGATLVLLVAGFALPPIVMFFAFGVPLGLLAGQLAGKPDWMLGFAPGFIVGGAIGVVMQRSVAAVLSSAAGAWLIIMGVMAALAPSVPALTWLEDNPVPTLALTGVIGLAGVVFQLFVRTSPEQANRRRAEQATAKRRAKENAALEARWSKYGKKA